MKRGVFDVGVKLDTDNLSDAHRRQRMAIRNAYLAATPAELQTAINQRQATGEWFVVACLLELAVMD